VTGGSGAGWRRRLIALAIAAASIGAAAGSTGGALAQAGGATPASGQVGPASGSKANWTFDPILGAGSGGTPIEVVCLPGQCSKFDLNIVLPQPDITFYQSYIATLTYTCSWAQPVPTDVDCFAFSPSGAEAAGPGRPDDTAGTSSETISITDPVSGHWSLRADEAAGVAASVTGVARLTYAPAPHPPVRTVLSDEQRFTNYDFDTSYQTRDALQRPNAGEPSLGVDWATGKAMYMAGNQVTQLTYNSALPPVPAPKDVTPANSQVNEDAILFTDRQTNRTWALGLLLAGSYIAFSDDDGGTWTPSVAFAPPAFPDHETLGSGPYHDPAPSHSYPHAVYYCAQTIVQDAYCGRSDDGGMTFTGLVPATPLWGSSGCSSIHGHVRIGPTGIVYVPNGGCKDSNGIGRVGVAVSADNGGSFAVSVVPDSSPSTSDPSVMEGPDGLVYLGYQAANGHPMIAVGTHDATGKITWRPSIDAGQFQDPGETEDGLAFGVQNTEFAEVVTGDPGRAAFAFLGTGRPGAYQSGDFQGTWYLFVSYTFDGGKSWHTVNATPNDPVQRGCVWNGGLVNACRNMLDFNDIGIDKQGHVYVAYTDGCTGLQQPGSYNCDTTAGIHGWNNVYSGQNPATGCGPSEGGNVLSTSTCSFARLSSIVRQVCGRGLIAAYDPGFHEDPRCTLATSTTSSTGGTTPNTGRTPPALAPWSGLVVVGGLGVAIAVARRRRTA